MASCAYAQMSFLLLLLPSWSNPALVSAAKFHGVRCKVSKVFGSSFGTTPCTSQNAHRQRRKQPALPVGGKSQLICQRLDGGGNVVERTT